MKLDDLDRLVLAIIGFALLSLLVGGAVLLAWVHGAPPWAVMPVPGLH